MPPSPRPSVTNTFFQPAISYLSRGRTPSPHHKRSDSLDSDGAPLSRQASNSHPASVPNHDGSIPLITFSRSPSPYPRSRSSAAASEDEDDDFGDIPPATPLFRQGRGRWGERRSWKGWLRNGGFGAWLFGSWGGWQVYVGFLVVFVGGTGFELVMLNRIILWSKCSDV
ncbi:MAG: hypothetical protein M1820_003803 [Bogoriella megaspora]|nr:MAG: hypothetical protein M1820_003803 [Bogoriella megaspora]